MPSPIDTATLRLHKASKALERAQSKLQSVEGNQNSAQREFYKVQLRDAEGEFDSACHQRKMAREAAPKAGMRP